MFPGSHESILRIPAAAAFHYAMIAERQRWQQFEDMRLASCYHRLDERSRERLLAKVSLMLSGPGEPLPWDSDWTDAEREAAAQAKAEVEAFRERLKQRGLLLDVREGLKIEQPPQRKVSRVK